MAVSYREESHTRRARGHSFTVTNMIPDYDEAERARVKREIGNALYRVFSKYRGEP